MHYAKERNCIGQSGGREPWQGPADPASELEKSGPCPAVSQIARAPEARWREAVASSCEGAGPPKSCNNRIGQNDGKREEIERQGFDLFSILLIHEDPSCPDPNRSDYEKKHH